MELARLEEDKHLRETYDLFRRFLESSTLAGWVFKAIIHRMLSGGRRSEGPTFPMISNGRNHPAFFSSLFSSAPDTSLSSPTPLRTRTRAVNFTQRGARQRQILYTPTTSLARFTIDPDLDRHTVVISVFQITTSTWHGGSTKDFPPSSAKSWPMYAHFSKTRASMPRSKSHTFRSAPTMDPNISGRCPSTGARASNPTAIARMSSVYAFPSRYVTIRRVYSNFATYS